MGLQAAATFDTSAGGIVGLVSLPTGCMWVLHKSGTVDRYTSAGRRLGSGECGASVTAAACVGQRVWLGFADGMIRQVFCGCLMLGQCYLLMRASCLLV